MRRAALAVSLAVAVAACASGPAEDAVVSSITKQSLLPALGESASAAASLSDAVDAFCAGASPETHEAVLSSWTSVKQAWGRAWLTTWFGPADMLRTVSRVDYQPISEDGIEELIASGEPLDVDYVMNQAASTQRGLGAVEYLAFDDPAIAAEPRRCELLSATAEVVAAETATLEAAWATGHDGNPPFAEAFAGENMPSNDALGELISSIVETLKQQSLFQVGKAIGVSSPQPEPEAIPEGSSGSAASFYHAQLDAIRSMLDSGTPNSLAELIAARSPEVGARIDEQLDAAMAELDGVEAPMREIAREDPASLEPLYEHLSQLLGLFESDVVSLLDVTLGFSDTDGDSG